MTRRTEMLGSTIQRELAEMILRDLQDPRLTGLPSITRVKVSPDLSIADVYVTIMGSEGHQTAALNALNWSGEFLLPDTAVLFDAAVLSLAASVLVSGVAVRVTWKAGTPGPAKLILKLSIIVATVICMYGCNRWQTDGLFVLTTQVIDRISWICSLGMLAVGALLLVLPTALRQ